jgi:hypothetical protein
MASLLKVDALQGITAAGDITVTSEGGAATQSLQQGLVKSYMALNGQGTISVRGSFNATSLTDAGTGEYIYSFVNHMQNNEYVPNTELQWDENDDNKVAFSCVRKSGSALDTGQTAIGTGYAYTSLFDPLRVFGQVVGDLA